MKYITFIRSEHNKNKTTFFDHFIKYNHDQINVRMDYLDYTELPKHNKWIYIYYMNDEVTPFEGGGFLQHIPSNVRSRLYKGEGNLFLEYSFEGITKRLMKELYNYLDKFGLPRKVISYLTSAQYAHKHHIEFCEEHNIDERINIFAFNIFEIIKYGWEDVNTYVKDKPHKYVCLNRALKCHRVATIAALKYEDQIDKGLVSFFANDGHGILEKDILDHLGFLGKVPLEDKKLEKYYKGYDLMEDELPYTLDCPTGINTRAKYSPTTNTEFYEQSYYSIVTESSFENRESPFHTEKIYKPIFYRHPFILIGPPRSLEALRKLGYKTFNGFINEKYDLIENDLDRLDAAIKEIKRLNSLTNKQWDKLIRDMKSVLDHNRWRIDNNIESYRLTDLYKLEQYAREDKE